MRHARDAQRAPPADRPATATAPAAAPTGSTSTGASTSAGCASTARRVNVHRAGGDRPPARVRPRPLGLLAELAGEHPAFAREHRVIALDLPGFGDSQMPREEISIPATRRCVDALLRRAGRRARDGRRQLDGRLHRRRAGDRVPRARRAARARLAPPALTHARACVHDSRSGGRADASRRARPTAAGSHRGRRADPPAAAAPDRCSGSSCRTPTGSTRAAGRRAGARLGQAGLPGGARRADHYPHPRPPGAHRLPDADRLGREGPADPGARRRPLRRADPRRAQGRLPRHRPRGDDRAPAARFNRLLEEFLRPEHGRGARPR